MQLCIALDLATKEENLALVKKLKDYDIWLKVGLRSYIRDGGEFLKEIKAINPEFKIFLDLKLYDIPNTMADAAESIISLGVDMFNVHASAGKRAMQTVMERLKNYEKRPIVLAVTALTSFSNEEFYDIYNADIDKMADKFAKDAYESGLDGVVCSAFESASIKRSTAPTFMTLTPGIRPFGEDAGDQKRVADVAFAKSAGVDFIVVGRPIYKADNPVEVVEKILKELQN
ncbi:Orotidine 5'-phosphate decarboxylase [hydrothermal vent metagenome]|uniref:Orotidine 5'-phosphate decarboxylase n=1 Tax=hydrothermal vent metagenome TaxID=652676 RepID=A0A1W1BUR7_9ZZZZ